METSAADLIENASNYILNYALLLSAVGTVTMAMVELIKGITNTRRRFHSYMVEAWTGMKENDSVLGELLVLGAGGRDNAAVLYDQPTAKMMGQIQAAANVALDYPSNFPNLYKFLVTIPKDSGSDADMRAWQEFTVAEFRLRADSSRALTSDESKKTREASEARARIANLVARKLDAFQTKTEYRWARMNQSFAMLSGGGFLMYILASASKSSDISDYFRIAVLSLAGGLIAPFSKDVVTALTGLAAKKQ